MHFAGFKEHRAHAVGRNAMHCSAVASGQVERAVWPESHVPNIGCLRIIDRSRFTRGRDAVYLRAGRGRGVEVPGGVERERMDLDGVGLKEDRTFAVRCDANDGCLRSGP